MIHQLVQSFVTKCGGPEKCLELLTALRALPKTEYPSYLARVAAGGNPGCQQLMALAMLGVTLALIECSPDREECLEFRPRTQQLGPLRECSGNGWYRCPQCEWFKEDDEE